ncbi:uncharacterized protein LOC114335990 [Diabrotica virgifera virgifera]|uniref:Uncharacterized protein LOC114335990 isoform X2 n=1 Tax=Diabrotica virgifera virgifera TaxID=50390 RepID=A0A6P7G2C7_DIAVI|nr:uncharacterized protein LOC114335990 [Diabrotica virgifera virgifera]
MSLNIYLNTMNNLNVSVVGLLMFFAFSVQSFRLGPFYSDRYDNCDCGCNPYYDNCNNGPYWDPSCNPCCEHKKTINIYESPLMDRYKLCVGRCGCDGFGYGSCGHGYGDGGCGNKGKWLHSPFSKQIYRIKTYSCL